MQKTLYKIIKLDIAFSKIGFFRHFVHEYLILFEAQNFHCNVAITFGLLFLPSAVANWLFGALLIYTENILLVEEHMSNTALCKKGGIKTLKTHVLV